ncbi:Ovochymase-2 [Mycoemilia scoparia]|uniref:Ovochymase-2 n=1 Tax=Mycoemilia scoparia TaxID=417184 RepID=A0A9W7ZTA9_9FUNG|nr:Ovochymase-2 [Mycoemilia scoparia]
MFLPGKPIVGGSEAKQFEFPFAVHVDIYPDPETHHICGGALISQQHVLTAGHCVYHIVNMAERGDDKQKQEQQQAEKIDSKSTQISVNSVIKVGYGDTMVQSFQKLTSDSFTLHPLYNPATLENDIAVLHLPEPVQVNLKVAPIPVYTGSIQAGSEMTIIGWGTTSNDDGARTSQSLYDATIKVPDNGQCQKHFGFGPIQNWNAPPDDRLICTGPLEEGKDACYGDSGGPLVMKMNQNGKEEYVLTGLTSFGNRLNGEFHPKCGMSDGFGFYTRVGAYTDFIRSATKLSATQLSRPMNYIQPAAAKSSAISLIHSTNGLNNVLLTPLSAAILFWFIFSKFLSN